MGVDADSKATILNFADDYGIENVPEERFLVAPLAVVTKVGENEPSQPPQVFTGPVRISNFSIFTEEVEGKTLLLVEYDSPAFERYYDYIAGMYKDVDHDPDLTFVLSYDYDGDHDLDNLSYNFNRYLPIITLTEDITGYYDDYELEGILFGNTEEPEG